MRLILLITLFCISCFSFGQDSLQIDTSLKVLPSTNVDSIVVDTVSSTLKDSPVKKKKQKKKIRKAKIKEEPDSSKVENTVNTDSSGNGNGFAILGILVIAIIIVLALSRLIFTTNERHENSTSRDEGFISDYLSRMLLPRREYYRNVYLKSEAWKRKRYVVLKRDNWRCVYCGARATQVHHTRYAKRNIGKEPIEWLVSICKPCHDSKH